MLRLFFIFAAIGISLFLTSCYTISKKDCLAGDWRGIGFTDGFNGYLPQARFEGHIKSCKRVKVVPDLTLWNQGYKKGLLRYCTAWSGLWEGQHGHGYNGLCPPKTEAEFLRGHEVGYRQYSLASELKRLKDEAGAKEEELEDLSRKLREAPEAEQYGIRSQIRDLESDLSRLHDKQRDIESELYLAEAAVARFQSEL